MSRLLQCQQNILALNQQQTVLLGKETWLKGGGGISDQIICPQAQLSAEQQNIFAIFKSKELRLSEAEVARKQMFCWILGYIG